MILGCSPDATSQDIRLVCQSTDTTTAGCDHLYQGSGAEGKIVRLPDNVSEPRTFAVISRRLTRFIAFSSAARVRLPALRNPGCLMISQSQLTLLQGSFKGMAHNPKSKL